MPTVHVGSILAAPTEVIVNPANSFLRHGGGLAKIIANAAQQVSVSAQTGRENVGQRIKANQFRAEQFRPSVATGNAVLTSAGTLPYKGIIHVVGPIWDGGTFFERELLARCVRAIGDICYVAGYRTVAVPAISCGLFRFPVEEAAGILLDEAARCERSYPVTFSFYVMGDEHAEAFRAAL